MNISESDERRNAAENYVTMEDIEENGIFLEQQIEEWRKLAGEMLNYYVLGQSRLRN